MAGVLGLLLPGVAHAATLVVTTTADSNDGNCTPALCSFRDALSKADGDPSGDLVTIGPGTYTGTMLGGNGVWAPSGEYTIRGAGAGKTIINGNGLSRVFAFYGKITVEGVTVTGGVGPGAGCACGGAFEVRQGGFLTLIDSVVQGNSAPDGGGGIDVDSESKAILENVLVSQNSTPANGGGGIRVEPLGAGGRLTMTNVTISGNSTTGGAAGAGLDNEGATTASNITIAGNVAAGEGGGVLNKSTGTLALDSATIATNIAGTTGAGIRNLAPAGTLTLRNTIVADGCSGVASPPVASQGHNLDAGSSCGLAALGDLSNANPLLGPLGEDGGTTGLPTMALMPGSPAIEAGDNAACAATDERGIVRPHGAVCDMGAFEYSPPVVATGAASAITTSAATVAGTVNSTAFEASARIEYGATTAYGSSTPVQGVGAGTSPVTVTAALPGLAPGTTYHYRIVATNRDGTSAGGDATFATSTAPVAPVISKASQSASRWREGRALPVASSKHKRKPPVGTTFSFTLNEQATVSFAFTQTARGRTVGKRCVAPLRHNRRKHKCTRVLTPGTLSFNGHSGTNKVVFQGRVSHAKKLGPGRYTLIITATNSAGQQSSPQRLSFTIVK